MVPRRSQSSACVDVVHWFYLATSRMSVHLSTLGTMVQFPSHLAVFEFGPLKGMVTVLPEQYKVKMD